ncbi:hypothetical protein RJT34_20629 [Clitoria ternatea]|uniref:Uncharacterized protein n=1 Tax=Clitoria ternatea TaxID=43366 RepID=A0AAN9P5Y9_CLITE
MFHDPEFVCSRGSNFAFDIEMIDIDVRFEQTNHHRTIFGVNIPPSVSYHINGDQDRSGLCINHTPIQLVHRFVFQVTGYQ